MNITGEIPHEPEIRFGEANWFSPASIRVTIARTLIGVENQYVIGSVELKTVKN
jgi:hypothetical protein